jgi:hypothetical protein
MRQLLKMNIGETCNNTLFGKSLVLSILKQLNKINQEDNFQEGVQEQEEAQGVFFSKQTRAFPLISSILNKQIHYFLDKVKVKGWVTCSTRINLLNKIS